MNTHQMKWREKLYMKKKKNANIKSFLSAALGALVVNILYNYFKF